MSASVSLPLVLFQVLLRPPAAMFPVQLRPTAGQWAGQATWAGTAAIRAHLRHFMRLVFSIWCPALPLAPHPVRPSRSGQRARPGPAGQARTSAWATTGQVTGRNRAVDSLVGRPWSGFEQPFLRSPACPIPG